MDDSEYGHLLVFVGVIQLLLAIAVGYAPQLLSDSYTARIQPMFDTNSLWMAISWGGILLIHMGRSAQAGLVIFDEDRPGRSRFYLVSAGAVAIGFLTLLLMFFLPK